MFTGKQTFANTIKNTSSCSPKMVVFQLFEPAVRSFTVRPTGADVDWLVNNSTSVLSLFVHLGRHTDAQCTLSENIRHGTGGLTNHEKAKADARDTESRTFYWEAEQFVDN